MEPTHSILDSSFRYVPAATTSVADTWRRFGWRPTTDEERAIRQRPHQRSLALPVTPGVLEPADSQRLRTPT